MIVDLAVEHDPNPPVLVGHRLATGCDINDSQAAKTQRNVGREVVATVVGTAVHDTRGHASDPRVRVGASAKMQDARDSAHLGYSIRDESVSSRSRLHKAIFTFTTPPRFDHTARTEQRRRPVFLSIELVEIAAKSSPGDVGQRQWVNVLAVDHGMPDPYRRSSSLHNDARWKHTQNPTGRTRLVSK